MTIIELLQNVGEKNVRIQRIDSSVLQAKSVHGETHLTIATNAVSVPDVMALTTGVPLPLHGLILWIPRELIPTPPAKHPVSSVMVFGNLNVACFNAAGEQIPALQKSLPTLLAEHAERCGYDLAGVGLETPDGKWRLFRTEDGGWNREAVPSP